MICSRTVFRCFKALERCADRVTGAAGPFFVAMAVLLNGSGMVAFFEVIAPTLSFPLLSIPICFLIALNLVLHYYYVCTTPPGFVTDSHGNVNAGTHDSDAGITIGELPGGIRITSARTTKCRKCGQMRPERAHRCWICKTCVLKYDHHCPWINQCVGIHNERHFVLFMFYLFSQALVLLYSGISYGTSFPGWEYYTPPVFFTLLFVLSSVLSFAVGIMLAFHLHNISKGEPSVEAQDFEVYQKWAGGRGENFVNSYDLGRVRNLKLFLKPLHTMFIPIRVRPYTDGWSWARKPGYEELRMDGDVLTDEDDDEMPQKP